MTETHVMHNDFLNLDGYLWRSNNRIDANPRVKSGSGDVGVFVNESVLVKYSSG